MKLKLLQIMVLFALMVIPERSYSYEGQTYQPHSKPGVFSTICKDEIKPGRFTGNIIRCVNKIVDTAGDRLLSTYVRFFASIVYYTVILAIMFHGMRMMFGMTKEHGITIVLIIKIVVVLYFCSMPGYALLRNVRTTLIDFPRAMTFAIVADRGFGIPVLDVIISPALGAFSSIAPNAASYLMFDELDKRFCAMLGGDTDGCAALQNVSDSSKMPAKSQIKIAALAAGLFATGGMGLTITMIILTYITAMLFLAAQIILFFVVVAIAINFLAAIAPLALACMLFEPTVRITKIWFNFLLIYTIQPIVFAAFLYVLIIVFSAATEAKNSSQEVIYKKAYERLGWKYENADNEEGSQISLFDCFGVQTSNDINSADANRQLSQNSSQISGTGTAGNLPNGTKKACDFSVPTISLDDDIGTTIAGIGLSAERKAVLTKTDIKNLLALKIAMVIFMVIMTSFAKTIPEMVNKMVGGGAGNLLGVAGKPMDKVINAGGSPAGKSIVEKLGDKGGKFVKGATRF